MKNIYDLAEALVNAQGKTKKAYAPARDFVTIMEEDSKLKEVYSEYFEIPKEPNAVHFGRHIREAIESSPEFKNITIIKRINNLACFRFTGDVDSANMDWDFDIVSKATEKRWAMERTKSMKEKKVVKKGDEPNPTQEKTGTEYKKSHWVDRRKSLFLYYGGVSQDNLIIKRPIENHETIYEIERAIEKVLSKHSSS